MQSNGIIRIGQKFQRATSSVRTPDSPMKGGNCCVVFSPCEQSGAKFESCIRVCGKVRVPLSESLNIVIGWLHDLVSSVAKFRCWSRPHQDASARLRSDRVSGLGI